MSNKSHKRKSSGSGERFFQMYHWFTNSEAWRATNVYERSLYIEIKQRYNGHNNGDIALSHREAEYLLNCSNKPVAAAFAGLIDKGFIKVAQIGSFHWKTRVAGGRSTRWILTEFPIDVPLRTLQPGTKDFMKWKPPQENSRYAKGIRKVRSGHTIGSDMVGREHTVKGVMYADGTR